MPTEIIRPTSTTSQTGWNVSPLHSNLGDNNVATVAEQTSTTCNGIMVLGDLSIDAASTINSIEATFVGVAGRTGTSVVTIAYSHSTDGAFGSSAKTVTSDGIYTYTARTTQQDGSSALTVAYVNALSIRVLPDTAGVTAKEVLVTVDYTLPVTAPFRGVYDNTEKKLHVTGGNVSISSGHLSL